MTAYIVRRPSGGGAEQAPLDIRHCVGLEFFHYDHLRDPALRLNSFRCQFKTFSFALYWAQRVERIRDIIHTYIRNKDFYGAHNIVLSPSASVSNRIKQVGFKMLFKHSKTV